MSSTPQISVVGAGGHAKVVISALRAAGYVAVKAYDDDPSLWGRQVLNVPVAGPISELHGSRSPAVMGIGDNRKRREVAEHLAGLEWITVVHPKAIVDPSAVVRPGTVIFAGAIVQPDTEIGAHCIVNTGATVDHDCRIADYAHLAPGSHVAGGVCICEGVLLGIGACITPGRSIGPWTIVGAGSAVTRDLPGGISAAGVPARLLTRGDREASETSPECDRGAND